MFMEKALPIFICIIVWISLHLVVIGEQRNLIPGKFELKFSMFIKGLRATAVNVIGVLLLVITIFH